MIRDQVFREEKVVATFLTYRLNRSIEQPENGMKPPNREYEQLKPQYQEVGSSMMRKFVQEYESKLIVRKRFSLLARNYDRGSRDSVRNGCPEFVGDEDRRAVAKPNLFSQLPRGLSQLRMVFSSVGKYSPRTEYRRNQNHDASTQMHHQQDAFP